MMWRRVLCWSCPSHIHELQKCRARRVRGKELLRGHPVEGDVEQTQAAKFTVSCTGCETGKSSSEIHICSGGSREWPSFNRATHCMRPCFPLAAAWRALCHPVRAGKPIMHHDTHALPLTYSEPRLWALWGWERPLVPLLLFPSDECQLRALLYASSFVLAFLKTALSLIVTPSTYMVASPTEFLFTWAFPRYCLSVPLRARSWKAEARSPVNPWWGI